MDSSNPRSCDVDSEFATVSRLRELSGLSYRMLDRMLYTSGPHAGLHCFRALPEASGQLRKDKESLRYSLIAWIGLIAAKGVSVTEGDDWRMARKQFSEVLGSNPERVTLGELGLLVWLGHLAGGDWIQAAVSQASQAHRDGGEQTDTLEIGWLLTGLLMHYTSTGEKSPLIEPLVQLIKRCYSPASGLFTFRPYRHSRIYTSTRYRHVLGSFASQVYSLFALASYLLSFSDPEAAEMIERCSDRICDLQGPNGEWWWIYDTRNGSIAMDFPVYSVHQDSMGPMALLRVMQALKRKPAKYVAAISKGLEYLFEYCGESAADRFIDTEYSAVWRALVRDVPGEDPALMPFGLSKMERDQLFRKGWPAPFRREKDLSALPQRILREARPYCPGWILLTEALSHDLWGLPKNA